MIKSPQTFRLAETESMLNAYKDQLRKKMRTSSLNQLPAARQEVGLNHWGLRVWVNFENGVETYGPLFGLLHFI